MVQRKSNLKFTCQPNALLTELSDGSRIYQGENIEIRDSGFTITRQIKGFKTFQVVIW